MRYGFVPLALLLLVSSIAIVAQRGTHGAASGASTGSAGSRGTPADDPDLADFKHAIQVQANPYQVAEFQTLSENTAEALRQAHELAQLSASAKSSAHILNHSTDLSYAVEEARKSNSEFVKMLTDGQTAGLKKLLKDLNKAETPVSKQRKTFGREIEQSNGDPKRIAEQADSLEKALTALQARQVNLAKEMGIPQH